jgi:hypothetical protein
VQSQNIGYRFTRMLLDQGIVAIRQQASVESLTDLWNPCNMHMVKDAGFNFRPVVHRHDRFLETESFYILP